MGAGKKKDDAVIPTGRLKVMAWERESLTEIQPLKDEPALPSDLDDRGTVRGALKQGKK